MLFILLINKIERQIIKQFTNIGTLHVLHNIISGGLLLQFLLIINLDSDFFLVRVINLYP